MRKSRAKGLKGLSHLPWYFAETTTANTSHLHPQHTTPLLNVSLPLHVCVFKPEDEFAEEFPLSARSSCHQEEVISAQTGILVPLSLVLMERTRSLFRQ